MDKTLQQKKATFKIKAVNEADYTIEGVFSTADPDWHGEIIDQSGWNLDIFKANPVILLAHNDCSLPVGKCIEIGIDQDGNLAGKIRFAAEEYEVAMTVFKLYAGMYMRAFSVGFMNDEMDMDGEGTILLKKNTLYEISCVSVPANPMALARSKGINTEPLERKLKELAEGKVETKKEEPKEEMKEPEKVEAETEEQQLEKALSAIPKKEKFIRDAIGTLTCLLKSITEADTQGEKEKSNTPAQQGGQPKAQVKEKLLINKAVRELLAAKKL